MSWDDERAGLVMPSGADVMLEDRRCARGLRPAGKWSGGVLGSL